MNSKNEKIKIMDAINKEIMDLWSKQSTAQTNGLMPLLYPPLKINKNKILFIGLNPSFSVSGVKSIVKDTEYQNIDIDNFYKYPTKDISTKKNQLIAIDRIAKEKHPYFNKFKKLSMHVKSEWDHVDLFFIRETNQENLKEKIGLKNQKKILKN